MFGLDLNLSSDVYTPREDTFLLIEVLKEELSKEDKVLDMGTGTGIVAMVAADRCKEVVGTDVNRKAVELARKNTSDNSIDNVNFLHSNLFEEVEGRFDLVAFNPPYLPGSEDERSMEGSEQWFGGEDGSEAIDRFSEEVKDYLSEEGRIILLVSSLTGLGRTKELFAEEGFETKLQQEKKIPWEKLFVLKITD